jgi:spore coat polysaccharide biosynthesis protein SpsF
MINFTDAAIVTVRNTSSRLPGKSIMNIKNNLRSIDIVIERAKQTGFPVILATSTSETDNIFESIAKQHEIEFFRGALLNKIKRWYDCFTKFNIENALLLDGDDLCHNYNIGGRALNQLKTSNVDMILNPPNIVTGFFTYAIKKSGMKKMYDIVNDENENTDVITRFIEKANLITEFVKLNDIECNENIRLTLDYEEDLQFFRKLYENVDILENGSNVIKFLSENKEILNINFYRQKDFLENQAKFNEGIK